MQKRSHLKTGQKHEPVEEKFSLFAAGRKVRFQHGSGTLHHEWDDATGARSLNDRGHGSCSLENMGQEALPQSEVHQGNWECDSGKQVGTSSMGVDPEWQ